VVAPIVAGHARRQVAPGHPLHHGRRLGERRRQRVERAVEPGHQLAVRAPVLLGAAALVQPPRLRRRRERPRLLHQPAHGALHGGEAVDRRPHVADDRVDRAGQVAQLVAVGGVEGLGLRLDVHAQVARRHRVERLPEPGHAQAAELLRPAGDGAQGARDARRQPQRDPDAQGDAERERAHDQPPGGRVDLVGAGARGGGALRVEGDELRERPGGRLVVLQRLAGHERAGRDRLALLDELRDARPALPVRRPLGDELLVQPALLGAT
jgi:hypothetical protein